MTIRMTRRMLSLLAVALVVCPSLLFAQATDAPATMPEADAPTPTAFDDPALVQQYQATITPEDLASHLYVFASDYFEGRETSTRGQKLAATYLAGQYRKMGVAPKGNVAPHDSYAPEAYFQTVPLYTQRLKRATLTVLNYEKEVAASTYGPGIADGQMYFAAGNIDAIRAGLVFAGYGIADDELGYNDFAALDRKSINRTGKWVMMLNDEPLANDSTSLLNTADGKPSRWTGSPNSKLRALLRGNGMPAGILLVADQGPHAVDVHEEAMERAASIKDGVGSLSLTEDGGEGRPFPPIYIISSDLADQMLAPLGRTIAEVKQTIDRSLEPEVFEVPGIMLASTVEHETVEAPSENVAAFIEGSDPALKDEVVVISSHYDHIGIESGSEGDLINNGADDDGSGTVGVLEMAEAFMKAKQDGHGPRRSILFLNVTGEEKGLLGSRYFTDMDPLLPLDKIVTDLNIDMIGRFDPTHPT
ncbi:MAG TPA: M28 family peptidase, partial [Rhodothermales bacterium]|nr:M28 family peptidase [Rhodothermales bacterium]